MKGKKFLGSLVAATVIATMMFSSVSAYASAGQQPVLPQSIIMDGREFIKDATAGGGSGTATPDNPTRMGRSAYTVTGSDVALYIDYSHGHGGDHFAAGWVQATAPSFTARAEVWSNGKLNTTGSNNLNVGNIANGCSYLALGIVSGATPRIFYNW